MISLGIASSYSAFISICSIMLNTFLKTAIGAVGRQFVSTALSGPDGSRTRVQKPIPCPSTSLVIHLTFPLRPGESHPKRFSSFMIRPPAQSFADVVSHRVDARVPKCGCFGSDKPPEATSSAAIRQQMLTDYYLQRLILIVEFNASRATRFSSFSFPVETFTSPYLIVMAAYDIHINCLFII